MLSLLGGSTELSSVQQGMELAPQNHMVTYRCLCVFKSCIMVTFSYVLLSLLFLACCCGIPEPL